MVVTRSMTKKHKDMLSRCHYEMRQGWNTIGCEDWKHLDAPIDCEDIVFDSYSEYYFHKPRRDLFYSWVIDDFCHHSNENTAKNRLEGVLNWIWEHGWLD